jgi:hypothetical protein
MSEQTTIDLSGDDLLRTARISDDGVYRYRLGRRWGSGPAATFIVLNPSTADATNDDPTIRRCIGFARRFGAGGLTVVNLYAFRATYPHDLWRADDPVGPENDQHLREVVATTALAGMPVVAAWGVNAKPDRVAEVLHLPGMTQLVALGVTKDGHPRHPVRLRNDARLSKWRHR